MEWQRPLGGRHWGGGLMLHNIIFGAPKNLLKLLSGAQSANGITSQVAASGLITLSGTAAADTTITIPVNNAAIGSGQYTASMAAKGGYATGAVSTNILQSAQATQVITNGNFVTSSNNLATGFSLYTSNAVSCTGNTQTFIATAQNGRLRNYSLTAGHKYFISVQVKASTPAVALQVSTASGNVNIYHPGDGAYHTLQTVAKVNNTFEVVVDSNASGWANISVQSFMAVDMGADTSNPLYNLTADQMAVLFTTYFDGTKTVTFTLASVSAGTSSTFTAAGQSIPSVQLFIPSGTVCQQYQLGLQIEAGSTATGWVSPGTQGVIFYPAVGETGTITNTGNVDAYPVITIVGSCANPSIANSTTGETIAVNVALGSKDKLVIDCRPATRGCYLNGTLTFGIKQGLGWIHCPPGDNVLTFERDGYDTKRHCTIALQGRYL
ncbi:MAG: phage tail protein [Ethanoligenens sp.]